MGRVAKQIADQQRAIDALKPAWPRDFVSPSVADLVGISELPRIPELHIPQNPIHETNERLQRIEERFSRMQEIATDAAKIATGLQAAAAEFLQKFEKAASENDRTAGRAIWIGVAAVIIAVAMPAIQIAYSEFRREPNYGPDIQATFNQVQAELSRLQDAQASTADRLSEALASSDRETAIVLRDIHALLSRPPESLVPQSNEALVPQS